LAFDPDALREKYRQERDKRLRADGNSQYREAVHGMRRTSQARRPHPSLPRMKPWAVFPLLAGLGLLLAACGGGAQGDTSSGASSPASASPPPSSAPLGKPNIILILTDDQTAADFAFMPKTQRLVAAQGTTLPNFFASTPLCCPSRATILRGQYAHNHGILTNGGATGGFRKFYETGLGESSVSTTLAAAGYHTAFVGHYLNGYPEDVQGLPQDYVPPGWNTWAVVPGPAGSRSYALTENGITTRYNASTDHLSDILAKRAEQLISTQAAVPGAFFLTLGLSAPHFPALPAERHRSLFASAKAPRGTAFGEQDISDKPAYVQRRPPLDQSAIALIDAEYAARLRSLQSVDDLVERVVGALSATGELANTYLFVTSDNGYMQGQHRIGRGKQVPYEESIRVSLLVRGPGVAAAASNEALSGNIDLVATFAAIAGVAAPSFVDGRSLLPLLSGSARPEAWRSSLLIEGWPSGVSGEDEAEIAIPPYRAMRTADALYVEYETGERELYNLARDPSQLTNLAASASPAALQAFSAYLAALAECKADDCRAAENTPPPASP
jgi:arylsulfatase A-like enzyme